jgi:hypothetical protein
MKELAKELAPLVVSAIRDTKGGQNEGEKCFRSSNKCSDRGERLEESQQERLGFLVSKMYPV